MGTVHPDTVLTTWLAMAIVIALLWWVGGSYRSPKASKRQTVFEGLIEYFADLTVSTLGRAGEPLAPFFIALFLFIFTMNQFGILPFKAMGLPFGGSPTGDLNTVLPYALGIFLMYNVIAIRKMGLRAYAHIFKPPFLAPIFVIDEIAKPTTLMARLFFNIWVGELLFTIISTIIQQHIMIGPVNVSLIAAAGPFFVQFFNFFVGTVQAFLFTLLAIVYTSLATADEH